MKIVKNCLLTLLVLLTLLSPVIFTLGTVLLTPKVYSDSYVGVLDEKYERLHSVEGEKIVVIGGSSVAFGLDSEYIENALGMPVVNFGLYGALGTVSMLELSLSGISEGDTVILAPELDRQMLSEFFSAREVLRAIDDDYSMLFDFSVDHKLSLLGGAYAHAAEKLGYAVTDTRPPISGIYSAESFNSYLDIASGLRRKNVMSLYYDPTTEVTLDKSIVDGEFIKTVNSYVSDCRERGAEVYFSFCPINRLALGENIDYAEIYEFSDYLDSMLDCEVIGDIGSYILDEAYFYDTNFHPNDFGVIVRCNRLIESLSEELELGYIELYDPPAPELPKYDYSYEGEDENSRYFTYSVENNGCLRITGLTDEGKQQSELTVPLGHEGRKVFSIGYGAFSGGSVTKLTVTEDTNLRNFLGGAFDGSRIEDLYIYYDYTDDENKLFPAPDFGGLTIHVPESCAFISGYDWSAGSTGGFDVVRIKK
ncbi:MAG: hypothetical protein J6C09_08245 [Clostridia bacterium]|nr:hypothetical protein [Clostridia bacterium]